MTFYQDLRIKTRPQLKKTENLNGSTICENNCKEIKSV